MFLAGCIGDMRSLNSACLFTTFFFLCGSPLVFLVYSITIIGCGENELTAVVSYDQPNAMDPLKKQIIVAAKIADGACQHPLSHNIIIFW
jgi:hypothetical protein